MKNSLFQHWQIHVLVPWLQSSDETLSYYYDYSQSLAELTQVFGDLKISWGWQLVSVENMKGVIDALQTKAKSEFLIVVNLCDGDELNGVPGISVIKQLAKSELIFTGSREAFYHITTCKIRMKEAFERASVATPSWKVIDLDGDGWRGAFANLDPPLIVKPAVSAGSMGISIKSVVRTDEELAAQLDVLRKGCHGWNTAEGGIYVERFLKGREFTTLIVGSAARASEAIVYAPVERVFDKHLPENERFLSFDRLWEFYEAENPLPLQAPLYIYEPVKDGLCDQIKMLSWDAYASVAGTGYGRVDLRMDGHGKLQVLEVNAQCGLSEDENFTSVGAILRFEKKSYSELILQILMEAVRESGKTFKEGRPDNENLCSST